MTIRNETVAATAAVGAMLFASFGVILTTCCGTSGSWGVDLLGVPNTVALARLRFIQPYSSVGALILLAVAIRFIVGPLVSRADRAPTNRSRMWLIWAAIVVAAVFLAAGHMQFFIGETARDEVGSTL